MILVDCPYPAKEKGSKTCKGKLYLHRGGVYRCTECKQLISVAVDMVAEPEAASDGTK
jgi:hypothetical protein